jgi:hypothetical protein
MNPESREPAPSSHVRTATLVVLGAVLLGIAALLVVRGWGHHGAAPTTPAPATASATPVATRAGAGSTTPSVPEIILSRHMDSDGVLDLEGILELFSYAVAPLPGVTVPSGGPDSTGDWAELALESIPPHLDELSQAQRDVVLPYYQPAAGTTPMSIEAGAATGGGSAAARRHGHVEQAAFFVPPDPPPAATPTLAVQVAIVTDIRGAVTAEAGKLGHAIGDAPTSGSPADVHVVFADKDLPLGNGKVGAAWTVGSHGPLNRDGTGNFSGGVTNCTIFVGPIIWAHWGPTPLELAQMYHEVFHCYQDFVIGHFTAAVAGGQPAWEKEGGATWAGASMTGYDEPAFGTYLGEPGKPLAQHSYDAVGFYFELEYLNRALWPEWWHVWTDAAIGGWSTTDWFTNITGPAYGTLDASWGASFYKDPGYGHAWDVTAPHQMSTSTVKPTGFSGGQQAITAPPYSTSQVVVFPQPAGTAVGISATGTTRLVDGSNQELVNASLIVLCWDNCSCPSDSPLGKLLFHVSGQVKWAMTSLAGGAQALLVTVPIADVCKAKKDDYPPPPPNPCPVACPGSNGDPHLVTVNLRRLEFQAAGEFTLLRSTDGRFEVQVRQEPVASRSVGATVNTAVALRLGAHRVGAYLKGDALETRVDGKVVTSTTDLGGDGRFVLHGSGFEADAPDGTSVWGLPIGHYGINLIVLPSAALRDHGAGVLARIAPGTALPPLPDGTTLPYTSASTDLYQFRYGRFADAWRVTDRTSLFDYDAGKSTASYTVTGFVPELGATPRVGLQPLGPVHPVVLDPAQRASAESVCGPVGTAELHDDCVFDVAVTGQNEFVAGYTAVATFGSRGPAAVYWGPKTLAAPPTVRATPGSTKLLADIMGMSGSVLAPDGALYATVDEGAPGNHTTQLVAIDPVAARVRAQAKIDATAGAATGLAFADGSVWVVASTFTSTGTSCRVVRMDAASLKVQASVPLQVCPSASPAIAASDGGVWVQQPVGGSGAQGELWRMDPSTNQIAGKVAVPNGQLTKAGMLLLGGSLRASATAVFWNNGPNVYRVRAPWSTAENLTGTLGLLYPAGDAALIERGPGMVDLFGAGPGRGGELAIPGRLVGTDGAQVYFDRPGTGGSEQLWSVPLSGGTPALVAEVPAGTAAPWNDSNDPRTPLWFAGRTLLTVVPLPESGGKLALYLVVVPLR